MARSYQPEVDYSDFDLSDDEDYSFEEETYDLMPALPRPGALGNQELLARIGLGSQPGSSSMQAPPVAPPPDPRLAAFRDAYFKSRFYHSTKGEHVPGLLEHGLRRDIGKDKGLDAGQGAPPQMGFNFLGGDRDTAKYYRGQAGAGSQTVRAFLDAEEYEYVLDDLGSANLSGYKARHDIPPERVMSGTFAENGGKDLGAIYGAIRSHLPEEMRTLPVEDVQQLHQQAILGQMLTHSPGQSNGKYSSLYSRYRFPWNEDGYNSE